MTSPAHAVTVTVLAVSSAPCSGKMTWETATAVLQERLRRRFGAHVLVQYVELFSPESFAFPEAMQEIQEERCHLPVVLVDREIVSEGKKLNEGLIARHFRQRLEESAH